MDLSLYKGGDIMISLIEKGKITDLQGNILTSSQQSVQNWTPAGDGTVDLSYADGVNHFEFSNYGESNAKARFIEEYRQIYGVVMPNAWADYFFNIWKNKGEASWPNNPYLYTYSEMGDYKNFLQVNSNSRLNESNVLQIYYGDKVNSVHNSQFSQNYVGTYYSNSAATFTMSNGGGNINHYWGSYEEWLSSITKNYTLSFNVDDGGTDLDKKTLLADTIQKIYGRTFKYESDLNYILDTWKQSNGNSLILSEVTNYDYYISVVIANQYSVGQDTITVTNAETFYLYHSGSIITSHSTRNTWSGTLDHLILINDLGTYNNFKILHNYLLSLFTRSTTGFTKDASKHDITLTNGNNTYTLEVNPTASQEYQQQNILFTPTSANCSLKLDLSGMQGSGIELDVKDIGVYEIGGEA